MYPCDSFITATNGLPLLCTLDGGHDGPHEAGMTGGEIAATWVTAAPAGSWRNK
jgi:hypothetical protein